MARFMLFSLFVALLSTTIVQSASDWSTLATLDCKGGLHLFPNHGLLHFGVQVPDVLPRVVTFLKNVFRDRAKCHCPSLTENELDLGFTPDFGVLLRALESTASIQVVSSCESSKNTSFAWDFTHLNDLIDFSLPTTCTSQRWMNNEPCLLKYEIPNLAIHLQLAISKCSSSPLPYISVTCDGVLCREFLRPCESDSDCESSKCRQINSDAITDVYKAFQNIAHQLRVYLKTSPSCTTISPETVGKKIVSSLLSFLSPLMGGMANKDFSSIKFCGIDDFPKSFNASTFQAGCTSTKSGNKNVVNCPNIKTWDGTLTGGSSVLSSERTSGSFFFPTPDDTNPSSSSVFPLVSYSCSSRVKIFSKGVIHLDAYLPALQSFFTHVTALANELLTCRNGGTPLSASQFITRFLPYQPALWLHMLSVHDARPFTPDRTSFTDLYSSIFEQFFRAPNFQNNFNYLNAPAGCTYDDWINNGACKFQFNALSSLLGKDIKIRVAVEKCSNLFSTPSISVDCLGDDCVSVFQPLTFTTCTENSDCATGGKCNIFPSTTWGFIDRLWNRERGSIIYIYIDNNVLYIPYDEWKIQLSNMFNYFGETNIFTPSMFALGSSYIYSSSSYISFNVGSYSNNILFPLEIAERVKSGLQTFDYNSRFNNFTIERRNQVLADMNTRFNISFIKSSTSISSSLSSYVLGARDQCDTAEKFQVDFINLLNVATNNPIKTLTANGRNGICSLPIQSFFDKQKRVDWAKTTFISNSVTKTIEVNGLTNYTVLLDDGSTGTTFGSTGTFGNSTSTASSLFSPSSFSPFVLILSLLILFF